MSQMQKRSGNDIPKDSQVDANESCGLTVFRNKSGKDLTDGQLKELLTKGKTGTIKGFKSKENKPFDAAVTFDAAYKTGFSFPPKTGNSKKRR